MTNPSHPLVVKLCLSSPDFRAPEGSEDSQLLGFWKNAAPTPMQSPEWMLHWWSEFQSKRLQLSLLVIKEGSEIIGLAPFFVESTWGVCKTLKFLASGKVCSDFQTFVSKPGKEAVVVDAVAEWMLNEGAEQWNILELDGVSDGDPMMARLVAHFQVEQYPIHQSRQPSTWRLDLIGGWEAVLARMSKAYRYQNRRLVREFDADESLRFRIVSKPSDMKDALQDFIRLHQQRWEAVGEPGCFACEKFKRFAESSVHELVRDNSVELFFLDCDSQPIAALLVMRDAMGNLFAYQSGRDPRFDTKKTGMMLHALSIRHACDRGCQFIDYLRGDEEYKSRLRAKPTGNQHLTIFSKMLAPQVCYQTTMLRQTLKQSVKSAGQFLHLVPASSSPSIQHVE